MTAIDTRPDGAASVDIPRPPAFGEPAPNFTTRSSVNPRWVFNTVGGRYVALVFLGDAAPERDAVLEILAARGDVFDDEKAAAFVIVRNADDAARVESAGLRVLYDDGDGVSQAWSIVPGDTGVWIIDPSMRVLGQEPLEQVDRIVDLLDRAPPPSAHAGVPLTAPVLMLPRVFEPDLCRALINHYRADGGEVSGFMRAVDGKTVLVHDPLHKRRTDVTVNDPRLLNATRSRILNRLVPEVQKAFQFRVTRMERYLVARYAAEDTGFFRAHRDNTTPGTAHRRFAVTINLNSDEYDGGELRFPEFGLRAYKPPTGGAVVFSCSLLHEATPVTRGERFAFLPFLYDHAAALIRERNAHTLGEGSEYSAGIARPPAAPAPRPPIGNRKARRRNAASAPR